MRLLTCLLPTILATSAATQDRTIPFKKFAQDFVAKHGISGAPESSQFSKALETKWVRLTIGGFTVRYPSATVNGKAAMGKLQQALQGVLDTQLVMAEWMGGKEKNKALLKAGVTFGKWIKSWKQRKVTKSLQSGVGDLLDVLEAPEAVHKAIKTLKEDLSNGKAFGLTADKPRSEQIVFCPTRQDFLETACFLGTLSEENKNALWQDNLITQCQSHIQDPFEMQIVALEYASPNQAGRDFTSSIDMNSREKNGLLQHVVRTTMNAIIRIWFGEEAPRSLMVGLTMNVTIAVCGEDNTRAGGDERGKSVGARVAFVPGGRSEGGLFAGANLDSMWRSTKGRDWFVRPLKRGLKSGAKKTKKQKFGAFLIHSDDQSEWKVVHAPFFSAPTGDVPTLPAQFTGDSKELLRAYTCCFVHWLRDKGMGKTKKASNAGFAALLHAIQAKPDSLETSCQKIYGVGLSRGSLDEDSLERRFLKKL